MTKAADAAKADLAELDRLRRYLNMKSSVDRRQLIDAIDDFAEELTGDRRVLQNRGHSIG